MHRYSNQPVLQTGSPQTALLPCPRFFFINCLHMFWINSGEILEIYGSPCPCTCRLLRSQARWTMPIFLGIPEFEIKGCSQSRTETGRDNKVKPIKSGGKKAREENSRGKTGQQKLHKGLLRDM